MSFSWFCRAAAHVYFNVALKWRPTAIITTLQTINESIMTFVLKTETFFSRGCNFEQRHDKTNKVTVRPAKTQISLGIRPVWSELSLSAWRKRMPRLIWVFAGRTVTLLVLSLIVHGSFIVRKSFSVRIGITLYRRIPSFRVHSGSSSDI